MRVLSQHERAPGLLVGALGELLDKINCIVRVLALATGCVAAPVRVVLPRGLDAEAVQASAERTRSLPFTPVCGGYLLVIG